VNSLYDKHGRREHSLQGMFPFSREQVIDFPGQLEETITQDSLVKRQPGFVFAKHRGCSHGALDRLEKGALAFPCKIGKGARAFLCERAAEYQSGKDGEEAERDPVAISPIQLIDPDIPSPRSNLHEIEE
jgi:hypothetical protein